MKSFYIRFLIMCIICGTYSFPLWASQTETLGESFAIQEITVKEKRSVQRYSQELEMFGHSMAVITGDQIREAGFVDLTKAIQAMVPGIFTSARQGRGGWTYTYLHGSDDILWLLDGVRITNPLYASDWTATLSIHQVDRIEVLKGGESVFYGSGARAGVINIITKEVGSETSGEVGISYGDMDYREAYGHVTDTINGHGFMVFGSYEASDGYQVCDDQSFSNASNPVKDREVGYDRSVVGGKYRRMFDLAGKPVLTVQAQTQQGVFEYPYPQYRYADNDWKEDLVILNWDHTVTPGFSYYLKTYIHTWWGEVTFLDPDGSYSWGSASNDAVWGYEDVGVNLSSSTTWGEGHELITGVDYQTYWGEEEAMDVPKTDRAHTYAGFASFRPYLSFLPKTKVAAGIRYTTTNEDMDSTIWDLSLRTPLWDAYYFRGTLGTSFTLPTLMQLYGTDRAGGTIGNPDLNPEKSRNLDLGLGGQWKFFRAELGYFYQDVEDMITTTTLSNGSSFYINADGETEIDGFEILVGIGPFNGITLNLSANWVNAEDKETGEQLERIPEFYTTANLSYRSGEGRFGADVMTRYTGDVYERGLSPFNDVNYGGFFVADASVFYKFGTANQHKVTLRVENIFDKDYATRYNRVTNPDSTSFLYNQHGLPRNFIVGYTYTF
ncbi:MAG: TonB-dependent receptor [Desulfobacterales bacterium]|nr:TonB-dependent receptor [Desulfobacterales bacterium]